MKKQTSLRLLAESNNERGDLFTRLIRDLFFALGYDNLRLDVHKSGREVDLQGEHRFEPRRVVAECKAHESKMGGAELNKFFGVLARERTRHPPNSVSGYFISLNGFTETAVEQEQETGDEGLILLDGSHVVEEFQRCRVVVSRSDAAEQAGRCAQYQKLKGGVFEHSELLGHERGYVWAITYTRGKQAIAFALIHADGTPLAESVARELIEVDKMIGGVLHDLQYLTAPEASDTRLLLTNQVSERYRKWVGEDCGYIQLDGLPADTDLSATRLKLERLFVPLKANLLAKPHDSEKEKDRLANTFMPIGEILETNVHIAVLAAPGGGKTTVIKRLATAYAFPERRSESADGLPERDWLPLILRCRELRDRAHRPITELLDDIPLHVGMNEDECGVFRELVHSALRSGRALLLIDGLDEISDEGARQTFAGHLRTLIAMFPRAALVVTSREAGFRLVAGVVASACEQIKLAPLDEQDVLGLCERWHIEVVGDNDRVRAEAIELGQTIWQNERIRKLAENPLLLTTLLVVKRWVGELPRSRTALYREAIRVLVRTWNVEGYAPLDEDETLAQLSYVACAMMGEGKQQIGQRALLDLLQKAREELEAELQFARISPKEFVERIEYRSSLLMQTGHQPTDGVLEPVYEFRHLTFQEYLVARGFVEEQYPGRDLGQTLAELLGSHFNEERWQEVTPLAAVLAGRKAEDLIKDLITECEQYHLESFSHRSRELNLPTILLYQCIRDEVQITGPTVRKALLEIAPNRLERSNESWVLSILKGKFGEIFRETVSEAYLSGRDGFHEYGSAMAQLACETLFPNGRRVVSDTGFQAVQEALESTDRDTRIRGALTCMELAYESRTVGPKSKTPHRTPNYSDLKLHIPKVLTPLMRMLSPGDMPSSAAASWAFAWIGENDLSDGPSPELLTNLFGLWQQCGFAPQARYLAWGFMAQKLLARDSITRGAWGDCDEFLRNSQSVHDDLLEMRIAGLIVGWYRRSPWADEELIEKIKAYFSPHVGNRKPGIRLLMQLGDAGRGAIDELKKMHPDLSDVSLTDTE